MSHAGMLGIEGEGSSRFGPTMRLQTMDDLDSIAVGVIYPDDFAATGIVAPLDGCTELRSNRFQIRS
jgi:hypothetical protein